MATEGMRPGALRHFSRSELLSMPAAQRSSHIIAFANFATRSMMFRLGLSCQEGKRKDLLLAAETFAKAEVQDLKDDTEELYMVIAARPLTAQNIATQVLDEIRLIRDSPVHHTSEEFLACFHPIRSRWIEADPEYRVWERFFEEYPIPPAIHRLVIFDQGSPMAVPSLPTRCPGMMRRYAQMMSVHRWLSIRAGREVTMFLQSQIASPQDKIALLELEFNVVNGIYGAHQGFTLIDKDTVVVDFNSFFPVRRITCDIALPAMIICPRAPDLPDQGVKTFTVDDPDVNGGVRLDVVGHDMCDPCTRQVWNTLKDEYDEATTTRVDFSSGCGANLVAYVRKMRY